jgi:hypothetical protein
MWRPMEKSHLLSVSDPKLTGSREEELRNEMRIVKTICNDIKMESGLKNVPEFLWKVVRFIEDSTQETVNNEMKEFACLRWL